MEAVNRHKKVLIVDFDVHHGNGTESIFKERNDVLYFSVHRKQKNFFPETGMLYIHINISAIQNNIIYAI